jgi:hypothetical protein
MPKEKAKMALTLKIDGNGHVIVKDGKPVYTDEDGGELAFDADQMRSKIAEIGAENKTYRLRTKELEDNLAKFGDVDPDDIESFLETLEELGGPDGIAELQSKGKVDVDAIKRSVADAYEVKLAEAEGKNQKLTARERQLLIGNGFATSQFLSQQTNLLPDMAEAYFGKFFRVEGEKAVAYVGDNVIFSKEKPGEPASIDEALSVLINQHPQKDRLLLSTGGGSGATGGAGKGYNPVYDGMSPVERLTAARAGGSKT